MQVGYRSSMSSPPAELSSIRNGPSSSRASCRQDGRPVTTTSALQEASADVTEASSSDSSSGSERPGRSSLRLMSAATLGIFALAATLVIASRTLEAGSPALVGDGQITGLDDVSRDEDVVVTFEAKTELPPLPQHKYGFEDEPVHLEGDAAFDLDTDLAKVVSAK
ncbi:hypothetical protein V5799_018611 [Amblyomma americanum]|uniref:Uncharacterized protein n=1 Tax=Amblyomma americanum TaxID=6943 RepID=A0AAQ4EZT7_AMBAM